MKHIKKLSDYAVAGGLGALLITGLTGCEDKNANQDQGQNAAFTNASQKQNAFVIVEALPNGGYTIADEYPSKDTRIVLRELDGSERILSKQEIDSLVKEEAVKIDNGTSTLTNPEADGEVTNNGGMGLGGVLLSSIAGAMIGSYIGNKLFGNSNFQSQRRTNYKSPSTYSKSVNSFNKAKTSAKKTSSKKSGFFGSKSRTSSSKTGFFGG
ncbi:MAG: UPF0323 family lipoprotein [Campylobacterota bacterium]|nr:UPF0323 family lipoprotein [Campylobacterota bacterium]